ncbi:hypothetical protein COCC4DRAFT_191712 [Bipolaris maydis ATCC 48331]|uniref:TLC domain-containing protein n=2 Tax=Cochliobolus heterostrophus TaxID=5016 RepID=M2V096_COCH5|nr:uncharacterized protein COCC4DRAFT_191712 [Bipolaris maydis ATCC 48331]EMD93463.1 hypothetical protein COCHEDRAFT_1223185 [Bipolaris maydis C5]KAJ5027781.1 TLC domain-containing protein [Bipolaris maydis]ENI07089.1 hypothetical protein COCC4DRAFT_191712 [Bipolaris maydis ATCC 48331]KAJ5062538.1 TLC domain-containing protein [Bipolaris maydis]KAJ6198811.1 TLC domain-containing protein [Bipolaris maydis]
MHDPFPIARPESLVKYVQPVADYLSLNTLPLHFHEVVAAYVLYDVTYRFIAPAFSRIFFPRVYATFNARTKLNWDVHIVSFVQSTLICSLALWVIWTDKELNSMDRIERVHGYTGASGLVQAFAGGYFLWDLVITVQNVKIFGIGMLFHAISALCVFSLGFRPFVNYYACTFILYELSSPFLNIHWFCDKLNMTGSTVQFVNGLMLLFTFFSCRLVWGTYQSIRVFGDVYHLYMNGYVPQHDPEVGKLSDDTYVNNAGFKNHLLQYSVGQTIPLWIISAYLASNLILNGLNWFWFGKMIETLRKRFDPPIGTRKAQPKVAAAPVEIPENEKVLIEGIHVSTPGVVEKDTEDYVNVASPKSLQFQKNKSGTHLEVKQSEVRSRNPSQRAAHAA